MLSNSKEIKKLRKNGASTSEFLDLAKTFEPLNNLVLYTPPENLYKLYNIFWVKINDIEELKCDTKNTVKFLDSVAPNKKNFRSKNKDQSLVNVDYYCSLVKIKRWGLLNTYLPDGKPIEIDKKCAETPLMKRH